MRFWREDWEMVRPRVYAIFRYPQGHPHYGRVAWEGYVAEEELEEHKRELEDWKGTPLTAEVLRRRPDEKELALRYWLLKARGYKLALRKQTKRLLKLQRRYRELAREAQEELILHATMEASAADYIGVLENENAHLRVMLGVLAERVQELEARAAELEQVLEDGRPVFRQVSDVYCEMLDRAKDEAEREKILEDSRKAIREAVGDWVERVNRIHYSE